MAAQAMTIPTVEVAAHSLSTPGSLACVVDPHGGT